MTPPFVKQGNQQSELFTALANMLTQAQPSSTRVDAPYVAQMNAIRQQNEFERAKEQDYYNKVRALAELRAQGSTPSAMFQRANNFVGDFITGNTPQQMVENVALDAVPLGKLFTALAPLAKVAKRVDDIPVASVGSTTGQGEQFLNKAARHWMDEARGQSILDDMYENNISPASVANEFWEKTYYRLPEESKRRFDKMYRATQGYTPQDAAQMSGSPQAFLDLGDDASYLEGTNRGFVALMAEANRRFGVAPDTKLIK